MRHRAERQNLKDIRKGRRETCKAVVCENYKSIYRFMVYLAGDANLAEDLTQETFVCAWANIGRYKGKASLKTWLHQIAYHKFVDARRKLKHNSTLMSNLKEEKRDVVKTLNPLCRLMTDECSRLLYEAMHKLQSPEYMVIVLHYIQDLSFREMAKVLDVPVGTVKWRTSEALKKLRASLTGRV